MPGAVSTHLRIAWRLYKLHRRVLIPSVLVLFGSWACLELSVVALHRLGVVLNVVLHLAFLILFSGLMVGLHRIALQALENAHAPTLKSLTAWLARGPSYLLALCLYLTAVAAGLALLVVPGVYLAVRYAFFGHVLAGRPASALDALREAASLSRGRWWTLFRLLLAVAALNLAGAALLGLGLLVSFPVALLATSNLFLSFQPSQCDGPRHHLAGAAAPPGLTIVQVTLPPSTVNTR